MKTYAAKAQEIDRQWYIIDAKNKVLGEVAVAAARLLRGKDKPIFSPNVDCGDFVVVINADKVRLTGRKEDNKTYTRFSGYVGGQKTENVATIRERHPELLIENAVRGMIPHNSLGRQIFRKLNVYAGDTHQHEAQNPQKVTLA